MFFFIVVGISIIVVSIYGNTTRYTYVPYFVGLKFWR